MSILTALSRLLRPPDCLACGAADAWPCCAACLPPEPAGPGPWRLAADPSVTLWALGPYRDALRAAIVAGKLRGQAAALHALGRRLGAALRSAGVGTDLVTWVAASPARGLPRDHAEQVAAGLAAVLDVPLVGLLAPAPGRDLGRSRRDGSRQVGGRPPPRCRHSLAGGRVLVVDDIATTGSTLAGAASVLRQAGARTVEVAVLAAAGTAFGPPSPSTSPPSGPAPFRRSALPGGVGSVLPSGVRSVLPGGPRSVLPGGGGAALPGGPGAVLPGGPAPPSGARWPRSLHRHTGHIPCRGGD